MSPGDCRQRPPGVYSGPFAQIQPGGSCQRYSSSNTVSNCGALYCTPALIDSWSQWPGGAASELQQTAVEPDFLLAPGVGLETEPGRQVEERMQVRHVVAEIADLDRGEEIRGL